MSPCILAHAGSANTAVNAITVIQRSSFDAAFGLGCSIIAPLHRSVIDSGRSLAQGQSKFEVL